MLIPISITLYNAEDEPIETYTRTVIPWGLIKKAARLGHALDEDTPTNQTWWRFIASADPKKSKEEQQMEAVSKFVVELFGNRFTQKQLEDGADFGEILAVFRSVMTRANDSLQANPTTPHPPTRK